MHGKHLKRFKFSACEANRDRHLAGFTFESQGNALGITWKYQQEKYSDIEEELLELRKNTYINPSKNSHSEALFGKPMIRNLPKHLCPSLSAMFPPCEHLPRDSREGPWSERVLPRRGGPHRPSRISFGIVFKGISFVFCLKKRFGINN